jgi:hypothetical protein
VKPKELQHVVFNAPSKTPGLPEQGRRLASGACKVLRCGEGAKERGW